MTKEKALYQAKLIIDGLSEEEYNLIPKDFLDYINENMEYDETITVDNNRPLEEQDIDDKTYDILEEMLNRVDKESIQEEEAEDVKGYDDLKEENNRLKELTESLKSENSKIAQIKDLVQNYKNELSKKTQENEELKAQNEILYNSINKCPWLVKKMFFKDFDKKLLK